MRKSATTRRVRSLTVVAAMATALVGMAPVAAVAGDGPGGGHHHKRGYVCDRLEQHGKAAVGSGHCRAINAPRHGHIRGHFTIENRKGHHHHKKVVCVNKHGSSGYANTPKWVRGTHCYKA
ncbi:hypothetical protein [Streptomyces spirodelae]|uniref:hypothetical protein n=1 Tax=Streptomyces spirodelae TaxID=2812904 RepID=UPI001E282D1D|nr:hypothetical protein [Streptomyces spirodelae]